MATTMSEEDSIFEGDGELSSMATKALIREAILLKSKIHVFKDEVHMTTLDLDGTKEKIKENQEKIKLNKNLPYLVRNIVEFSYVSAHSYLYFCKF